jgi:hypothetical protein
LCIIDLEPGLNNDLKSVKKKKEGLSIIDLGYNSIKVSNYGIYKNGHYKKQGQQQGYVQIGNNLFKNKNVIQYQNIERTVKFLNKIKNESKQMKINTVVPIATSAVRDAYRICHPPLCCAQTDNQVQTVLKPYLMGLYNLTR